MRLTSPVLSFIFVHVTTKTIISATTRETRETVATGIETGRTYQTGYVNIGSTRLTPTATLSRQSSQVSGAESAHLLNVCSGISSAEVHTLAGLTVGLFTYRMDSCRTPRQCAAQVQQTTLALTEEFMTMMIERTKTIIAQVYCLCSANTRRAENTAFWQ